MPNEPRYSEEDFINILVKAGQRAASNQDSFAKALGVEHPQGQLFVTHEEVNKLIDLKLGSIGLPVETNAERIETINKLRDTFKLRENSAEFGKKLLWGTLIGAASTLITVLLYLLGVKGIH